MTGTAVRGLSSAVYRLRSIVCGSFMQFSPSPHHQQNSLLMMRFLPLFFLLAFCQNCIGQSLPDIDGWSSIERRIVKGERLSEVRNELSLIRAAAINQKNDVVLARSLYLIMHIDDRKKEDSLFFFNSGFIDSLITGNSSPMMKGIMYFIKAKRLMYFRDKYKSRIDRHLFKSPDSVEYGRMTRSQLDSVCVSNFNLSLKYATSLKEVKASEILWLSYNPMLFPFKPGFVDLVYAERIYSVRVPFTLPLSDETGKWFDRSPDEFLPLVNIPAADHSGVQDVFDAFNDWAAYYKKTDLSRFYTIEFIARKFLYDAYQGDSLSADRYEAYVQNAINSPYSPVKASAIERLFTLWIGKAQLYNQADYLDYAKHIYSAPHAFDGRYRLYYKKAIQLMNEHDALLDSFLYIKRQLNTSKREFLKKNAVWSVNDDQLPGQLILSHLKYRNIGKLYVRIARSTKANNLQGVPLYEKYTGTFLKDTVYDLPWSDDHQWHYTFIKLDSFATGKYVVFFSDKEFGENNKPDHFVFSVSNLATIHDGHRLFVLDRKTGMPVPGTTVIVEDQVRKANASGYIRIEEDEEEAYVLEGTDSLSVDLDISDDDVPGDLYNKDNYDDLLEYFKDNISVRFFTDRSIYRPGQTVKYKGILFVRNPGNGEWKVFNKKNVRSGLFKNLFSSLNKGRGVVKIMNPFRQAIDSLSFLPDEFGAFSGTFVLADNAATGEWEFETDTFDKSYGRNNSFQVEEYKRPSFEITLQDPTGELQLGNNFSVKAKVRSFAGASLDNILIRYSVTASGSLPDPKSGSSYHSEDLLSGSARTDLNGGFKLSVADSLRLSGYVFDRKKSWSVSYYVKVEAIDNTGESHESTIRVDLSTRPVMLKMQMPAIIDRHKIVPYYVSATSRYAGQQIKNVTVKLIRLSKENTRERRNDWLETDVWVHSRKQLTDWFPGVDFLWEDKEGREEVIYTTGLTAGGDEKFKMPVELLTAGVYAVEITSAEEGVTTGYLRQEFTVFDTKEKKLPAGLDNFYTLPVNAGKRGEEIKWISGNANGPVFSVFHITYFERFRNTVRVKNIYETVRQDAGLSEWTFRIPGNVVGNLNITQQYVLNNEFYYNTSIVYVSSKQSLAPRLAVEKYRTKLKPGESEVFKVSIRTNDPGTAAQLMTTMYDASLEKLEPLRWELSLNKGYYYPRTEWEKDHLSDAKGFLEKPAKVPGNDFYLKPVWWVNDEFPVAVLSFEYNNPDHNFSNMLQGRVAGLSVAGGENFSEVVVVGYGTQKKLSMTGAVTNVTIRGAGGLSSFGKTLVILDGVIYEGDPGKINEALITSAAILNDATATALYGSRAANGVLLLSTKGPVEIPNIKEEPPPARKNFSETAFFYPQLKADKNGVFTISFTLPESVTEWKWKMLAHTKAGGVAFEERTVFSQLPLMIQPDMPRFLYQGDQLVLKSRISNLDSVSRTGVVRCVIEDVGSGDDLSPQLLKTSSRSFSVNARSNGFVGLTLTIPDTMVNPIRIRIIASGEGFSDGEEHIIPILSKRILVAQPTILSGDTVLSKPSLPADAIPYAVSLFIQPKRTATVLNALPYLANYSFNCTEQLFNKMLAHQTALKLMRTDTSLRADYAAKQRGPARKAVLLDSLAEGRGESVPWLQLEFAKEKQQRDLFMLMDTMEAKRKISSYFQLIAENQQADGGMSWFSGGKSDPYISMYLLGALGKTKTDSLPLTGTGLADYYKHKSLIERLISYCDSLFERNSSSVYDDYWAYARSYWWREHTPSIAAREKLDSLLASHLPQTRIAATGRLAMLLSASLRMTPRESSTYREAVELLESLYQQAIIDAKGIRWKTLSGSDDLSHTAEEWLVKIAEAFDESKNYPEVSKGIVQWLQQAKQDNRWSTTKTTGSVIALMSRAKAFDENPTNAIDAKADAFKMHVTDDMFDGGSYDFHRVYGKGFPEKLSVAAVHPAQTRGAINHYYFTSAPPVMDGSTLLKKEIFRLNKATDQWEPLLNEHAVKIADRLRVVLTIEASRRLEYVYIEEKRAAAFEPAEVLSGYEYTRGFSYYRSVTDEGFRFFASRIPSGISTITYEMIAAKEGTFSSGIGSLECMYQPTVKVYTRNTIMKVEPVE
jgi:alpha-2-macroglobulin